MKVKQWAGIACPECYRPIGPGHYETYYCEYGAEGSFEALYDEVVRVLELDTSKPWQAIPMNTINAEEIPVG